VGVVVEGKTGLGATDAVGVTVGVAVRVGIGVDVGVVVGVLVCVGVAVGVPVAVIVGVGVGIKKATTWLAPLSTLGLTRIAPNTMPATKSALPTILRYLPRSQSGNRAASRSAPQVGHTW
jgi:hypothetical protein